MEKQKPLTSVFSILTLIDTFPLVESQSSYAGGHAVSRIFILVTKFIFILEKERKKESFQTILLLT